MRTLSFRLKNVIFACFACSGLLASVPANAKDSVEWDGELSAIQCDAIANGTKFTLDTNQKVPESQVSALCSCIATETQQKGWELDALSKVAKGQEVSAITKSGAIHRFGKAVKYCSRGKFYVSSEIASESSFLNSYTLHALGLLGGGPIGFYISPFVYELVGQNVIIWAIVGAVVGGPLWQLTIAIFAYLIMFVIAFIKPGN